MLEQHDLGIRQQDRQFRPGQAQPARLALGELGIAGQVFDLAVEQALGFQRADEMLLGADARDRHALHQADRLVLAIIVEQDQARDFVGHRRDLGVARVIGQFAAPHRVAEQDLDVDLVVGGIHARRVVDEVGVEQHAIERRLDAAALGESQVAALAHQLATQILAVDANRVVGAVADIRIGFGFGLDVGADAAVPQQIDRRLEDRALEVVRRQRIRAGIDAQRLAHRCGNWNRLRTQRIHAAAGADQLRVVVRPRRTRQLEQALAFGKGFAGIRIRVEEDVAVIECGKQARVPRQQHAVAEYVAGHVADADAGEVLILAVARQRAEMALDRLPAAARGDAHALVVVTDRTARRERVAEPETVFGGNRVRDVGKRGCTLVRGDDQIRIVRVVAHAILRMHDLAVDQVVGDVEHAVHEQAVAGDALGKLCIAITADGRALDEKSALGTDRHDDGVLDHLRLDQAQDLGAEILAPIRPAQATARDRAEAQVHGFHTRRVDENLAVGFRLGQVRHPGRIELEADVFARAASGRLEVAGAQHRADHAEEAAQDAIFIQARHAVEQDAQRRDDRLHLRVARLAAHIDQGIHEPAVGTCDFCGQQDFKLAAQALARALEYGLARILALRIELGFEELDQQARDQRITVEGFLHVALRKRRIGLHDVLADAAQHRDLAPTQIRAEDQLVEAVAFRLPAPDALEAGLESITHLVEVETQRRRRFDFEILDHRSAVAEFHLVGMFGQDLQAHVLEHRQRFGQGDRRAVAEQLEAQTVAILAAAIQGQAQVTGILQAGDGFHIQRRNLGADVLDVTRGQRPAKAGSQLDPLLLAMLAHQLVAQAVAPVAHDLADAIFELRGVVLGNRAGRRARDQVQARQRGFADTDRRIHAFAAEGFLEQALDALAHVGGEAVARHEHHARKEAAVLVATHEQART